MPTFEEVKEIGELQFSRRLVTGAEAAGEEEAGEAADDGVGEEVALERREHKAHGSIVRNLHNRLHYSIVTSTSHFRNNQSIA